MIYRFMYQNPPKATRSASMVLRGTAKDLSIIAKAAYQAKYGTDMVADGYNFYDHSIEAADVYAGDPGTDADGGAKGPKPSILDLIAPAYSKKVDYDPKSDTVTFHGGSDDEGDEDPTLYQAVNGKYRKRDEVTEADGRVKEIISEAFEDIDRPYRYLQGEIDLIDAAYLLFPWDQFKGFMKITIMRYTLRYEHKGWLKDLDKITVYTRRLKELEVKNKEREERKNEK